MVAVYGDKPKIKWYLTPVSIIIAILAAGPFALPLVWMSPALKKWLKVVITAALILFTIWLVKASVDIYRTIFKQMQDLKCLLS